MTLHMHTIDESWAIETIDVTLAGLRALGGAEIKFHGFSSICSNRFIKLVSFD